MLVSCQFQGTDKKEDNRTGQNRAGENGTSDRGHGTRSAQLVGSGRLGSVDRVGSSQVGLGFVCGSARGFVPGFCSGVLFRVFV